MNTAMFLLVRRSGQLTKRIPSFATRQARLLTVPPPQNVAAPSATSDAQPRRPPKNWLSEKLETNPTARKAFIALVNVMGYGSPKQVAGRRAFAMYENCCIVNADEDKQFWQDGTCSDSASPRAWHSILEL